MLHEFFLKNKKRIFPAKGKIPLIKNWVTAPINNIALKTHFGNFIWALDPWDLVIDVDIKNDGDKSYYKLLEDIRDSRENIISTVNLEKDVITPSGGYHIYLSLPKNLKRRSIKKNNSFYLGIDFLGYGDCVVIPPSEDYRIVGNLTQPSAPFSVLSELVGGANRLIQIDCVNHINDDDPLFAALKPSKEETRNLLRQLSDSLPYDQWILVGMDLHSWNNEEGLKLWIEWSATQPKFNPYVIRLKWRSFHSERGDGSLSILKRLVNKKKEGGSKNVLEKTFVELYKKQIEQINYPKQLKGLFLKRILSQSKDNILSDEGKRQVCAAIDTRLTHLGQNPDAGENITSKESKQKDKKIILKPDFCKDLVWLLRDKVYCNKSSFMEIDIISFNRLYNSKIGKGVYNAHAYCSKIGWIENVETKMYLPHMSQGIVTLDNCNYLNSFDTKNLPVISNVFSNNSKESIELFKRFLLYLSAGEKERYQLLLEYTAHLVQLPGIKMPYCIVFETRTKRLTDVFFKIFSLIIGNNNVKSTSTQIFTDFNKGWSEQYLLAIVKDLFLPVKTKELTRDRIKKHLTDDFLDIGVKRHSVYNPTNYIAFTRSVADLELKDLDNQFIIFDKLRKKDLSSIVNEDLDSFLINVEKKCSRFCDDIRKYLMEEHKIAIDMTNEYNLDIPSLRQSREMALRLGDENSLLRDEVYGEIRLIFAKPFHRVISLNVIYKSLILDSKSNIRSQSFRMVLQDLDYVYLGDVKLHNRVHQLWSKEDLLLQEAIKLFNDWDDNRSNI